MDVNAIGSVLEAVITPSAMRTVAPGVAAQQLFSDLLKTAGINSVQAQLTPDNLLAAQSLLNKMSVTVDLTAKVAGSLTQSINKLVSMQ